MDDHDACDPLSFKGQMAARYKERLSMGFSLTSGNKGDAELSIVGSSNVAGAPEPRRSCVRQGASKTTEHVLVPSEARKKAVRNTTPSNLPTTSRSRSSLDDRQRSSSSKPTMKELITKFETRSFTSGQLKQNEDSDCDRQRIARETRENSCHKITMELEPTAVNSSSSSDIADSKSSASFSKPPQAQTSRGALSLNSDTNNPKKYMLQSGNRPLSKTKSSRTPNRHGGEDALNVTNSHLQDEFQSTNIRSGLKDRDINTDIMSGAAHHAKNVDRAFPGNAGHRSKAEDQETHVAAPLRVSIRSAAARKKTTMGNKYVVHKKDWGKRLSNAQKEQIPITAFSNQANNCQDPLWNPENDNDIGDEDVKTLEAIEPHRESTEVASHQMHAMNSPTTVEKHGMRFSTRENERLEDEHDRRSDDKLTTKAMERYLQFLRSSNLSQQQNAPLEGNTVERSDQRKSLRPPTPHRMLQLRKSSSGVPRNSLNAHKQIPSKQEGPEIKTRMEKDNRSEELSRRRLRSKLAIPRERKDILIDPSGGDFYLNPPVSSSNSIDSSVFEFQNSRSPEPRIERPNSETSEIKLTRPVPTGKHASKWAYLPSKSNIAKNVQRTHNRPHSARTHELSMKKQNKQNLSSWRARSLSTSKSRPPAETAEPSPLSCVSPKSITSVSSNHIDPVVPPIPSHYFNGGNRNTRTLKCDASDIGSVILTEDELADNDLVPLHLREKSTRELSGHISVVLSSSEDSYRAESKTPITKRNAAQMSKKVAHEKHHDYSQDIDAVGINYLNKHETKQAKNLQSNEDTKNMKNNPQDGKRSVDSNKLFVLHGKRRTTNTPTKFGEKEDTRDDSSNHRNQSLLNMRSTNVQFSAAGRGNKAVDMLLNLGKKDVRDNKDGSNLVSSGIIDDFGDGIGSRECREGRERKSKENVVSTLEQPGFGRWGDLVMAAGESYSEKANNYQQGKTTNPAKGSPTKKSLRQALTGHTTSVVREHAKARKILDSADYSLPYDSVTKSRDSHPMPEHIYNSLHFGHIEGNLENISDQENKKEKASSVSPHKKRRRADLPKKSKTKKKRKTEEWIDETSAGDKGHIVTKPITEKKAVKEKGKESLKDKDDSNDRTDRTDKTEKSGNLEKIIYSKDVSYKINHQSGTQKKDNSLSWQSGTQKKDNYLSWSSKKAVSRENSITSTLSDLKLSPKVAVVCTNNAPEKISTSKNVLLQMLSIKDGSHPKMTCEPSLNLPFKSQIPLLVNSHATPSRKLDRLIQYRRWREAMLDCLRPSKLPLSDAFRKKLDSAVMEEWALHCWQPSRDMYVDSDGVWWSASYQEVQIGDVTESILGDGRLFSREGLLDLTSRLPYMKLGPVRFLHASYMLMAIACVTLGHMGARLYHCGGDDYEYYCPDDDFECLMEMFTR